MNAKTAMLFSMMLVLLNVTVIHAVSSRGEFTFTVLSGRVINNYYAPRLDPFDFRIGFGYSRIFPDWHMRFDGDLVCTAGELRHRDIVLVVSHVQNEQLQTMQPVYLRTEFHSVFMHANLVPCMIKGPVYAGVGVGIGYRRVSFRNAEKFDRALLELMPVTSVGYQWKYVQFGVYMDGFVSRLGAQLKMNLLSIRRSVIKR